MSTPSTDPSRCPLCGQPNRCAMEIERETGEKQGPCWCVSVDFTPALLAQVPALNALITPVGGGGLAAGVAISRPISLAMATTLRTASASTPATMPSYTLAVTTVSPGAARSATTL